MKKLYSLAACMFLIIALTGCQELDIIGNNSVKAFEAVQAASTYVFKDDASGGWLLIIDESAVFFLSSDFSKSEYDVAMMFTSEPFINAGLDISKLPEDMVVFEEILAAGNNYTDEAPNYSGEITPVASYEQIFKFKPEMIGYHDEDHHYMLHFGNGNMLMFARDISAQEKDIVFMLDPQPFIDAGVDVNNVEGWSYGSYETMTLDGKKVMVQRFVKTFDLK